MTKRQTYIITICIACALVVLGIFTRLVPHPANMTAVGAVAIFAGAVLPKRWGIVVPVGIMALSDILIGFHDLVLFTWGSFLISLAIGRALRGRIHTLGVLGGSLIGSIQFFLVTNWAVWAFTPMYQKNFAGLLESYLLGLPFFRNMLVGDVLFAGLLFGIYAVAVATVTSLSRKSVTANRYE